jgi:signal transduction histidine kinase/ActR/RegA family two-component response regulator
LKIEAKISELTKPLLKGYIDHPSVIAEKARVLLFANLIGLFLISLTGINSVLQGNTLFVWAHIIVGVAFMTALVFIKAVKHLVASTISLIGLLIFDLFHMVKGMMAQTAEMIIQPMGDITITLLVGFIFIGFISFKKWQLYIYLIFSLLLLTTYYLITVNIRVSSIVPEELHFITIDYLIVILAGGLGVFLNLNLTNRLTLIEKKRTNQLNAYNDNLELLIFERTNTLDEKNQELKEKNKILAEQQKRIIKASRVKEEFLSSVSHELRTPLNAVVGLTDILIKNDPKDNHEKNLNILKYSTNNLLRIIDDVLDISKIEENKFEFKNEQFNLRELLDSIHEVYRANASIKKLNFNYSFSPSTPSQLIGDSVRLNQILSNLLSNAIKFTEQGAIELNVVTIKESKQNVTIMFSVKDTGFGILEENQHKVFEKFTQLNQNKIAGTGLGLSIVKQMVDSMGGQIKLKSIFEKGSEFSVIFTYPIYQEAPSETKKENSDLTGKSILLVEDNMVNQMVAQQLLSIKNPTITIANNGLEAVELCKETVFDVILMDIQMPVMDGLEATSIIRVDKKNKTTPIIALTANIGAMAKKETLEVGMNGFVGKPFKADFLFKEIAKALASCDT